MRIENTFAAADAGRFPVRRMPTGARSLCCLFAASVCFGFGAVARADTTIFFNSTQVAEHVASGVTSETISSNGYLFTYTRDKLFTGGGGAPIGRRERISWPNGVEAQAVTTPPPGVTDYKARITLRRVDGEVFDLVSFTARLLANTAGTGGAIEIMPLVNGEDGLNDPLSFDVSGYYGNSFSYDESPNPWGSTAALKGFDTYKIGLFVDYAFTSLTLASAAAPAPCFADFNQDGGIDGADVEAFFVAWEAGDSSADVNLDGGVDGADVETFFTAWEAGGCG